ncbi:hypothetical protein DYBT9623_05515 [Dyadobacter sp. CECT 9623]|uniref:Uncharacterized protein n=1 Tax=Dyadobacter linearis TaxID=2823330 RepID=A0ABM8UYR5_9BACT|nr:hypothetical protein DYBT9623_05515 [Dyadobacter sp. CECT 9623]
MKNLNSYPYSVDNYVNNDQILLVIANILWITRCITLKIG